MVSTWLPVCGELLWIDLFIMCNMAFAYLALLESMVVVLLQDKRTKTFFPEEWQWAIEKILPKKKASHNSTFENRFGAPTVPLACIFSLANMSRRFIVHNECSDVLSYAAIEFRERAAFKSLEIQESFGKKATKERKSTRELKRALTRTSIRALTRESNQNITHGLRRQNSGIERWEELLSELFDPPSEEASEGNDDPTLGEKPDVLADRLVFYEKLFFEVDTSEQGCADLNPLAHSSRPLSGLSMRPALSPTHPPRTCEGGLRWTRSMLCCPFWRCASTAAAPSIIFRPILTMTAA